jgi:hypothetical protein
MPTMLTSAQVPYTGPYSIAGNGKHKGKTAKALKRTMKRAGFGFKDTEFDEMDEVFNQALEDALDRWDPGNNGYGDGRWKRIRALKLANGDFAMDALSQKMIQDEVNALLPVVPALGPVGLGCVSILNQDLTHATDGIALYPALDDVFDEGASVIAPESMVITRRSSSRPGDACYATGNSGIRYWFGHLVAAPAPGKRFGKGVTFGKVAPNNIGGGPHVHVGINVEGIWGPRKQLAHHTNYTHGAPLIGAQLKAHGLL